MSLKPKLCVLFPQLDSVLDLITGGSRSTTPVSLNSRKSPTAEMGVQVNQKDGNRRNNNRGEQGGRMDSQGSHENRVSFRQCSELPIFLSMHRIGF